VRQSSKMASSIGSKYRPHETAADLMAGKNTAIFTLRLLHSSGTTQQHRMSFGQAYELAAAARDVCEATLELVRQFGLAFSSQGLVFHVSLNNVLLSTLRTFSCFNSVPPFPQLHQRNALKDVAVSTVTQLLAFIEFVRLSLQELQDQHIPGFEQSPRSLIVFSGLNLLLADQNSKTLGLVKSAMSRLSEQRDILVVWISGGITSGGVGTIDNPVKSVMAGKHPLIFHSTTDAYI